jgi:hypothetical protein
MTNPRRKLAPIPLEIVFDNPKAVALSAAALGMLTRLVWVYWLSDCAPLPEAPERLFAIAQANRSTWSAHKETILEIMAESAPLLKFRFEDRVRKIDNLRRLAHNSHSIQALRAIEKRERSDAAAPTQPRVQVKKERPRPGPSDSGFADRLYK